MSRSWVIWSMLVVCGLLIVGAMGWLTRRTLGMEQERAVSEVRAKLEERVRLAMSRMDAEAAALLVVENQRPPEHYQAFYEPKAVFTKTLQLVDGGVVMQPSPLLSEAPDLLKLHFEVWADKKLTSPQVPTGNERDLAEASGVGQEILEQSRQRLEELRKLLAESPESMPPTVQRSRNVEALEAAKEPGQEALVRDNLSVMIDSTLPENVFWNGLPMEKLEEQSEWVESQLKEVVNNNIYSAKQQDDYTQQLTQVDRGKRLQAYEQAQSRALDSATKGSKSLNYDLKSPAPSSQALLGKVARGRVSEVMPQVSAEANDRDAAARPLAVADAAAFVPVPSALAAGREDAFGAADEVKMEELADSSQVTPLQPVWLGDDLVAVRQVQSSAGEVRYQGFWMDVMALKASLLDGISDLLPDADLVPVSAVMDEKLPPWSSGFTTDAPVEDDSRVLVTLPWKLDQGVQVDPMLAAVTPFPVGLGIGWVAVVLAMVAAAGLVRGVLKMSERRAAFVSSVTHELRTPLTTFQLYSDLLAEGMVTDADKRQSYLETMRLEAGRLNHLIENVLAYSRIERGSARARREALGLTALVERFQGRLADRAVHEQARFEVSGIEDCAGVMVSTDVTAIEQIVFNLVDNACKYGLPDEGERVVTLHLGVDGRKARIAVCDNGHGISWRERRRLFRPFHKSAYDAANSKPGVGLGLALCRRLARALGGDLTVDCKRELGACFVLTLPVTSK